MTSADKVGQFPLGDRPVNRLGYGAMQLAGPHVMGPPADHDGALAVLRRAIELGVDHIDTSDYYGPYVTNELIREALHPYPEDLRIVTKVGAFRDAEGGWPVAREPGLIRHLGLSTVTAEQVAEAQAIAPVACVQNFYNVAHRADDALIDDLA